MYYDIVPCMAHDEMREKDPEIQSCFYDLCILYYTLLLKTAEEVTKLYIGFSIEF